MVPRWILTVLVAVAVVAVGGTVLADVTLDFETVPGGGPPVIFDPVADAYAPWGATLFSSQGVTGEPQFINGYPGAVTFAAALGCTYPPGHNLSVEFVPGVRYVSARVLTAEGTTLTMRALDGTGTELDAVTSAPAPADLWAGTLEVGPTAADIASVEWWPSISSSTVGVDDLAYGPAPEPATLALVGVGAAVLVSRRRRERHRDRDI